MSAYNDFALFYDLLMRDVDYSARTDYLLTIFEKYGKKPSLLLDLACGTGNFSNEFARRNIEVIGVDCSQEMLGIAQENSTQKKTDILFLCQKAEELDLYGTVDGVICCMDSINHITDKKSLKNAIQKISLFCEPKSLFIFDVNTPYKHREILGNNTFIIEKENVFCIWQNEYNEKTLTTNILLDFFVDKNGLYKRYSEEISERAYTQQELSTILQDCGFELLAIFDDMTENIPIDISERIVFVAKKI